MRLTLTASLVLCGLYFTGCESLNKTVRRPGKTPAVPEQLANDSQRREAAAKQAGQQASRPEAADKSIQQANFAPANAGQGTELDAMLLQAKQAEDAQQNQAAGALYGQVLLKQPQNAEAHHRLGVLSDQAGQYAEAQKHYQLALQQDPQNASLLSDIGYSYYSQDRLDEAEQYLTGALQIQPQNQYARNNLAHVYGRRAQQTGSATDYKLAQEQFMLAVGPQGAEQQMKQFFPQGAAPHQRGGALNPFQKSDKTVARAGSKLQAPPPNSKKDGNEELARQMDQIRRQMEASGQIPPKRTANPGDRNLGARDPAIPATNVPFERLNEELSRIDYEATRQQNQALRQSNSWGQRGGYPTDRSGLNNQRGDIEQVGGSNDPQAPAVQPLNRYAQDAGNAPGWDDRSSPLAAPNAMSEGTPGGWNQTNSDARFSSDRNGRRSDADPMSGRGYPNPNQYGPPGQMNDSNQNPGTNDAADPGFSQQSWPSKQGSPSPTNARSASWDGVPIVNELVTGRDSNSAYVPNDPTYRTGNGQPFGPQRPGSSSRNSNDMNSNAAPGWDDGREVAAQLGLDAGLGDMFPGGAGQDVNGQYPQGNSTGRRNGAPGRRLDTFMTPDPSLSPTATTPRGMPPGGNGHVSPADYNYSAPDFQNNNYSQGVTPAMGENYGAQGDDISAPWNQSGPTQRNSRSAPQNQQSQWGADAGASQGRFAPSRQSSSTPQNFGAPPMYYGR